MAIEQDNVAILRDGYARWNESKGRSVDHWLSLMADDIDFRSLADGMEGLDFTVRKNARAAVTDYFNELLKRFELIHFTVEDFIAQDDKVVVVGSTAWRNRLTGKVFDTPKVDIVRLRDGLIVEVREFYDTAKVMEASKP